MTIAVFGSINMDVTAYMHRLPKPGRDAAGHGIQAGPRRQGRQPGGGRAKARQRRAPSSAASAPMISPSPPNANSPPTASILARCATDDQRRHRHRHHQCGRGWRELHFPHRRQQSAHGRERRRARAARAREGQTCCFSSSRYRSPPRWPPRPSSGPMAAPSSSIPHRHPRAAFQPMC